MKLPRTDPGTPAWWRLYAILPLAGGACLLTTWIPAASPWRRLAELAAAAVVLGLLRLWIAGNRAAVLREVPLADGGLPVRIVYLFLPLRVWRDLGLRAPELPHTLPESPARPVLQPTGSRRT